MDRGADRHGLERHRPVGRIVSTPATPTEEERAELHLLEVRETR